MKQVFSLLTFFLFIVAFTTNAQYPADKYHGKSDAGPRERSFDMKHLKLDVSFEPKKRLVKGDITHTFEVIRKEMDSIFLDAPGIDIQNATFDGQEIAFTRNAKGVILRFDEPLSWGEKHKISFEYQAQPHKGIYFIGWNDTTGRSRRQIWTQGQGIDNRQWIPSFDNQNDKVVTEMIVHFDSDYKVLSNGELLDKDRNRQEGTTTWHYEISEPHSPYLIMLGIGKYGIEKRKSESGVPMELWYYPDQKDHIEPTYRYSAKMMDWMEDEFGVPYPWKNYSQIPVQDFIYGAMENTTSTIYGDFYYIDERSFPTQNYVNVNAHELVHQWWGDYVTEIDATHHWLHESFATHYAKHFEREVFGEMHFQWERRKELRSALNAAKNGHKPLAHKNAGYQRHYPKGSLILDMLRYVVGEEQYKKAVTNFLEKHSYDLVDSHRFYLSFFETLGMNLNWFWDQWIYRGGVPEYTVSFEDKTVDGQRITAFNVAQTHETDEIIGTYKMPIIFEVHYEDGSSDSKKVWIEKKHETVQVTNEDDKEIDYVLFDPNDRVVKRLNFNKPFEMLRSQALQAENMLDRYDALKAMKNIPMTKKRQTLHKIYNKEPFNVLRSQAISQMMGDEESRAIIRKGLQDEHVNVRLNTISRMDDISKEFIPEVKKLLNDSSYAVVDRALEKLCRQFPDKTEEYLQATKDDTGSVGRSVQITRLEMGATYLNEDDYIPQLVDYTSHSFEFVTRRNAMGVLKRLNYLDQELISNLFDARTSTNGRLRGKAKQTLNYFMDQTKYKKMINNAYEDDKWTAWEKQKLSGVVGG
jgi:aminopeptidase N